jgi:hypothetical protein
MRGIRAATRTNWPNARSISTSPNLTRQMQVTHSRRWLLEKRNGNDAEIILGRDRSCARSTTRTLVDSSRTAVQGNNRAAVCLLAFRAGWPQAGLRSGGVLGKCVRAAKWSSTPQQRKPEARSHCPVHCLYGEVRETNASLRHGRQARAAMGLFRSTDVSRSKWGPGG